VSQEHLLYIPQRIKILITAVALVFFILSLAVVGFLIFTGVDAGIVTTGLTLAQTCAAGLSVIALVFYTRVSVNVAYLKQNTDRYLVEELPQSMKIIDCEENSFVPLSEEYRSPPLKSKTQVLIKHEQGNHYCQYRVLAYGIALQIYVQVNVKRMVVSYFLRDDLMNLSDVKEKLEYVVKAAETAGYSYRYDTVYDNADISSFVQLRLFRDLPDDFLVNASERLFVANDFASMTRALIRALPTASTIS
jgi:hypothetical protein